MKVAFFAPLKAPDHAVPSGDRTVARGLIAALEYVGVTVDLVSTLRLYDGTGDAQTQAALFAAAGQEVARLTAAPQGWTHWVTYHNYYKAPDLVGPRVSAALGIPYLQIESTRARKRLNGPWARFAAEAEAASDAAAAIFFFTTHDAETLERDAPAGQRLVHLSPFLARTSLPDPSNLSGPLLSVGMMRRGDKVASYRIVAEALSLLPSDLDWHLEIAGNGPARDEVQALMSRFGSRVTFLGACDARALEGCYARARALVWPGVNEAFGMVYLEAQAAGVPVVAQDRPGVRDVVAGAHPPPQAGALPLAQKIVTLCNEPEEARRASKAAREKVAHTHLLPAAATRLAQTLAAVT